MTGFRALGRGEAVRFQSGPAAMALAVVQCSFHFSSSGVTMRKHLIGFLVLSSIQLMAQTATKPAAKPAVKKPAAAATSGPPTAIIDTTAGKLTCTLFPDKAPIGTANFIGL